jgi:hypothetical protein
MLDSASRNLCTTFDELWYLFISGGDERNKMLRNSSSFSEILRNLQRSKISIQDWSLSDLTVGLYLIYLSQASVDKSEEFKGIQIFSESIVCPFPSFLVQNYLFVFFSFSLYFVL